MRILKRTLRHIRALFGQILFALIWMELCPSPASADYLFYGTPGQAAAAQMMSDLRGVFENVQNARRSKEDLNAEFTDARARVAASCADKKVHDEAAETELISLLDAKDIYFLTAALAGAAAQDTNRVQALEDITGGAIDGGIPLHAEFMFDRWANSVNAELDGAPAWDPSAIVSAISRSQQEYVQYVAFRNKAEIDGFFKGTGQSQDMLDPSPEALADTYLSAVLKPAIAKSSTNADETAAETRWADEVRAAIVAYEKAGLDPKAIADHLRGDYPADIVQEFLDKAKSPNADLTQAYEDAWEEASAREGNPGMIPPSRNKLLFNLKAWSTKVAVTRLGGLMSNDALAKIGLNPIDEYLSKRETLKIIAGPSRDWCTGESLHGPEGRTKRADIPNEAADDAKTSEAAEAEKAAAAAKEKSEAADAAAEASKPSVSAASPTTPAYEAGGPIPLDRAIVNLLSASAATDSLSREALANIVSRRWVVENSGPSFSGDRFFAAGKRQPTPEEAAGFGAQFVAWAKGEAMPLPARVMLRQKLTIRKGEGVSWNNLDCFGGSYASLTNDSNLMMGINSALGSLQRKVADGTASRQEKLQYAAGQAALVSMGILKPAGVDCNMGYAGDGTYFSDAVATVFRFDQGLPSFNIDILGDAKDVNVNMTLEITGVGWSARPPQAIDVVPSDMQASVAELISIPKQDVKPGSAFVTLDARLVSGQVLDTAGNQLATLEPSSLSQLQSLISQYQKLQAEPDAPPPPPAPPPNAASPQTATQDGPDLIGIRLGMGFDEAEKIVRKHMEVGRVLDGRRAFDNEIKSGFNEPLTSGKLFISKDDREFIALIDEPPAADRHVMAAWRRVYVPPETHEPEEIFSQIKEKYGPPKIPGEYMGYWYKADMNCSWLLQVSPKPLADVWMDGGQPANIVAPNRAAYSNAGPFFPISFYDPLGQKPSDCGPVVYAAIFKAQPPFSPMTELNMTLTDRDIYVAAYSASRKLLRAQASKTDSGSVGGSPAVKF